MPITPICRQSFAALLPIRETRAAARYPEALGDAAASLQNPDARYVATFQVKCWRLFCDGYGYRYRPASVSLHVEPFVPVQLT
jgi:hypothetical protein